MNKLIKNNKYIGAFILSSTIFLSACDNKSEEIIPTNIPVETPNYIIKIIDQENNDIDSEINSLGITEIDYKVGSVYKVLRFKDKNNYYKVMFVIIYVDYNNNETIYRVCNAFTKEEIFKTNSLDCINTYDESNIFNDALVLSIDNLGDKDKFILDGCSEDYLFMIPDDINSVSLSEYDIANIYINLVPKNFRINEEYKVLEK